MKPILSILPIVCFTCFVFAQQVQTTSYTLPQSIDIALANNLQVKQRELQSQTAAINLSQAKTNLLPDISANVNHGANQGRSIDPFSNTYVNQNVNYANYSLNGGIVLFNGLIQRNLVNQSRLSYEAAKMEQQQARDELTLNVVFTYFQILNNGEQLNQAKLQAEVTRKQVERSKILSDEGAIAPSQLSDLLGQLANDELFVINSQNALNSSKIALAQLMNVNYDRNFRVERIAVDAVTANYSDPETIYVLALKQLAVVQGAVLRREAAEKAIRVARGGHYPQLSLSGNLFSNYSSAAQSSRVVSTQNSPNGDYVEVSGSKLPVMTERNVLENNKISYNNQLKNNYGSTVNIGLRIPVFNSLRTRNQISIAKLELNNAELAEETTKLQLKQAVDLAWFNMMAAKERYEASRRQVLSFSQSFKAAEVRFTAGAGTVVDYMIAKNNLDRANANLINARYECLLRAKVLDYYQGKLSF